MIRSRSGVDVINIIAPRNPTGETIHFVYFLSVMKLYIHTYLIDHSRLELFRDNET